MRAGGSGQANCFKKCCWIILHWVKYCF